MRHIKRRSTVILALATAGAVAVAGVAMGAANSTVTLNFQPSNLPTNTFQNGKIFVHTHTNYTNPGNQNPGGATERAQLYFDDDFKVNTNAAAKCDPNSISGATVTLRQAMNRCGSSLVGKGRAQAIYDPPPPGGGTNTVNACVRIFNGKGSTSEVLLFTRVQVGVPPNNTINCTTNGSQGNVTVLLKGDLKANPANVPGTNDADFKDPDNCSAPTRKGCQLDFNNITDHAALPLSDFNVNAQKGSYVAARCHDGNHRLNLRTKFTYNNNTTQVVNASKACT